jgi:nucleoside-diphosphate-sugar epimerase
VEQTVAMVTVTGGTGVLGCALVPSMQADGHQVTVLTGRSAAHVPSDLASGDGLDAAVGEAEVVVHLATQPFRPARVDVRGTSALIQAVRRCGNGPHLVYVPIVGVDRIPWPITSARGRLRSWSPAQGFRSPFSGPPSFTT